MASVSELYPSKYLSAEDLAGRSALVTVESATVETMRQQDGSEALLITLVFAGKQKTLVLNKTRAQAMKQITGQDDSDDWAGWPVVLKATKASNGMMTIAILAPSPTFGGEGAQPAPPAPPNGDIPF